MSQAPVTTTQDTPPRAHCTADADGRITFHLPALEASDPASAQLLVRLRPKKGEPEKTSHVLSVEAADGGGRAVLEPQPALPEGRWDVYLLPEPGAPRLRLRPGMRDLRALVDGHTRDRPSPVAVRVPYTTKDGYLAVRTWLRAGHAEIEGIEVTDGTLTLKARLHGAATLSEEAVVRLRARGANGPVRTLRPQVEGDGRRFSFTADIAELTVEGSRVWDLGVRPRSADGTSYIRIGRLLDDVADRKEIFVYPSATVGGLVVRPYYTVDNDLSVEVTAAE
ncbi:transferase [Streptomyces cinnabarinus]|uniref:Transferase n=1 Tax=Streptomyces cinnabarinus TaxID=67287 RepID=A0ABY7KRK1_9ACTN|nr:transferase [Streptomyces cinnabarinus]WAZ26260.1 transferase [Streptomyces cinnabarinus]